MCSTEVVPAQHWALGFVRGKSLRDMSGRLQYHM